MLKESSSFNANDALVNADPLNPKMVESKGRIEFHVSDFPKAILREANKTFKQSGVNSLCLASGFVSLPGNTNTPIILTPCEHKYNKVKETISFSLLEDACFVNPYLKKVLESELNIDIGEFENSTDMQEWQSLLEQNDLKPNLELELIGNFHHHRFLVIKELEELLERDSFNPNLSSLLLGEKTDESNHSLPKGNLFPADIDHEKVFESVATKNTVVQGPPGTGKSQVLTNLVSKISLAKKSTLVLSEKRAALEVISKRLAEKGLDQLCFIATSDLLSRDLLTDMKKSWDYFESYDQKTTTSIHHSEQLEDSIQISLDLLSNPNLIGGVSFKKFKALDEPYKNTSNRVYHSNVPLIQDYLTHKDLVTKIYEQSLNNVVGSIRSGVIKNHLLDGIDLKLEKWNNSLADLSKSFNIETWNDLSSIMKQAANCQIFENDLYKKYTSIFKPNSRAQKRFLSLRKKLLKISPKEHEIKASSHWKKVPSTIEVEDLLTSLESKSWLKHRRIKKRWRALSNLDVESAPKALKELQDLHIIDSQISQIKVDFCELGIEDPDSEVTIIYQSLPHYSEDRWDFYDSLSTEQRLVITSSHDAISNVYSDMRNYFDLDDNQNILDLLKQLEKSISSLIVLKSELKHLNSDFLQGLKRNNSIENFESELLYSHGVDFRERFPNFSEFNVQQLSSKIEETLSVFESESNTLANQIKQQVKLKFDSYHELLNTPAYKLKDEQKALKKRLRKGKSILIKEFAKTRSHPSLRQLFESEAKEWIQALKPIWLSNPTQLANCFPQNEGLFDYCIFDEASQIPLQNALGAIQRSERIIVAGDEHQMGPTNYFKAGGSEVINLLHQASYYWVKAPLLHHYRSVHPDLIKFSNKHFYQGELKAYPSYGASTPIHFHYIESGRFIERKNLEEAKTVVKLIQDGLKSSDEIGVVAFSEEQLSTIWDQLDGSSKDKLTDLQQNNRAFFKSIENVQGDECDHLIISFGYGKDEQGDFHMRFGPMNTENGRKRLNVLLTRARKQLDFVSSVKSNDFKITSNESVRLIQQWFSFVEQYKESSEMNLPYDSMNYTTNDSKLIVELPHTALNSTRELITFYQVMSNRGWKVEFN